MPTEAPARRSWRTGTAGGRRSSAWATAAACGELRCQLGLGRRVRAGFT